MPSSAPGDASEIARSRLERRAERAPVAREEADRRRSEERLLIAREPVGEIPLVPLGMLVSIHDRDRVEVVSRWPRCLAVVSA
jgi:hypothetical protein